MEKLNMGKNTESNQKRTMDPAFLIMHFHSIDKTCFLLK